MVLLSVLDDEFVLPKVDGLVAVGLAVPHPDVSLHQHGLAGEHQLGVGRHPGARRVEHVYQLLHVALHRQHVLGGGGRY